MNQLINKNLYIEHIDQFSSNGHICHNCKLIWYFPVKATYIYFTCNMFILLFKVALNTINQTKPICFVYLYIFFVYCTVKHAHAVTSVKQSPVLKGHLFLFRY